MFDWHSISPQIIKFVKLGETLTASVKGAKQVTPKIVYTINCCAIMAHKDHWQAVPGTAITTIIIMINWESGRIRQHPSSKVCRWTRFISHLKLYKNRIHKIMFIFLAMNTREVILTILELQLNSYELAMIKIRCWRFYKYKKSYRSRAQ